MNKKIITLLAVSFLVGHIQAAEKSPRPPQERVSTVEYNEKIYQLTPTQSQQYGQTMRGKDEEVKTDKLKAFFAAIDEDFPERVQKTAALLQREKLEEQRQEDAVRAELFETAMGTGMNAEQALEEVEKQRKGIPVRAPMAPAMIGADGERHPVPAAQEGMCPDHPHAACGCMTPETPKEIELEECAVCRNDLLPQEAASLFVTPCGHTFHDECFTQLRKKTNLCPSCKQVIGVPTEQQIAREQEQREAAEAVEEVAGFERRQKENEAAHQRAALRRARERVLKERREKVEREEREAAAARQQVAERERQEQVERAEREAAAARQQVAERERQEQVERAELQRRTRYQTATVATLVIMSAILTYKYFNK
jgi:hypothetical protein